MDESLFKYLESYNLFFFVLIIFSIKSFFSPSFSFSGNKNEKGIEDIVFLLSIKLEFSFRAFILLFKSVIRLKFLFLRFIKLFPKNFLLKFKFWILFLLIRNFL